MKIITNTAISLDGRIATKKNDFMHLGSDNDLKRMSFIRAKSDAILVGGKTFRNGPTPHLPNPNHMPDDYQVQKTWNIIVSRKMEFDFSNEFKEEENIKPLFLTSNQDIKDFPFDYKVCDEDLNPSWIIDQLKPLGIQTLLIEAGGDIIYQFLKSRLIDEMYLTLTPHIIGAKGASSLADGEGFLKNQFPSFKLIDLEQIEDEIFLHYKLN
jgi:5-amino-6-(5-phosphoribosylamino)uracil reductase